MTLQLIADKLQRLVWRRRLWGVDERQAWHVVQRLDEMYRQLYREQQVRYEALLEQARAESAARAVRVQPTHIPAISPQQVTSPMRPHPVAKHQHRKKPKGSHSK